jgi:hypothetical protein
MILAQIQVCFNRTSKCLDFWQNRVSYLWPNCRKAQLLYINTRAKILHVGQLRAPIVRVVLCVKKPTEAADLANHL